MDLRRIAKDRLASQQVARTAFKSAKELVGWMGAMQAQDEEMVKWAVGMRLRNATQQAVEAAISAGEILRTHALRPTWHLVSADDIHWLLELTAPHIKTSLKSRHRDLELSEAVLRKSNATIVQALQGGDHLTRQELIGALEKAGIVTTDNRASHLFMAAELEGILCSGEVKGGKQTYALLEVRVPKPAALSREEALAWLAKRYFASHAPATLQDFAWWSGLPMGQARLALELVKADFISETVASQTYWFPPATPLAEPGLEPVYLLPAFDEYLISYADRRASLTHEDFNKAVSNNGVFRPVIVVNSEVTGIWRRTVKKDRVVVEIEAFHPHSESIHDRIEHEANRYGQFIGKEIEVRSITK